ncbi:MAG: hypothetical protein HY721_17070 [Planctomycetes bacterium]|nr:hypothetical protein [Planctomycetota bacterium]
MTAATAAAVLGTALAGAGALEPPGAVLGFDPAAEGAVLDSSQVAAYLEHAAAATGRVRIETIGLSTEGRPLLCAAIGSPEALSRLEELARTRERTVVLITCGVHPAETGSTAAALPLVHRLVSGRTARAREILERLVVLLVPCLNPDGMDRVAAWLRGEGRGGREGSTGPLPFLQHRFGGHDLNRDWMLGTQPETRAVIARVHNRSRPWVTVDLHQMRGGGPRVFVPPYAEPVDPSIPSDLLAVLDALGGRVLEGLTASGRRGAARRWTYDAWTPARAYPFYHGGVRFLVEVAADGPSGAGGRDADESSLRVFEGENEATADHPAPWRGGPWGRAEVVDHLVAATELVLGALLDERLRGAQASHLASLGAPGRILLPRRGADPAVLAELARALDRGGASVKPSLDGLTAEDPAWGRGWCRSLLLCKEYPAVGAGAGAHHRPYDTTCHDLAHLAGLEAREAASAGNADTDEASEAAAAAAGARGALPRQIPDRGPWLLSTASLAVHRELWDLAEGGTRLERLLEPFDAAGVRFEPGDLLVAGAPRAWVERLATAGAVPAAAQPGDTAPAPARAAFSPPALGLLASPAPSADEGWLRWVLEEHRFRFGIAGDMAAGAPFALPAARPGARRVVVAAEGALEAAGPEAEALRAFVRGGGRVVALGPAAREAAKLAGVRLEEAGTDAFAIPGTLLRTRFAGAGPRDPVLWGYPSPPGVFVAGGPLWKEPGDPRAEPLLRVDPDDPRLCGRLLEAEREAVRGAAALLRVRDGERGGEWLLFGFSPHYRGWAMGTFRLLFNAILAP